MSQRQHTLFDNASIVRKSDPDTSHMAAAKIVPVLNLTQERLLEVVAHRSEPLTANEAAVIAAERYGKMSETYRKRMKELLDCGVVRQVGTRECRVTGHVAGVFRKV